MSRNPQQGQYLHYPDLLLMLNPPSVHPSHTNCWVRAIYQRADFNAQNATVAKVHFAGIHRGGLLYVIT
jgi:hypothetical protein